MPLELRQATSTKDSIEKNIQEGLELLKGLSKVLETTPEDIIKAGTSAILARYNECPCPSCSLITICSTIGIMMLREAHARGN